MSEEKDQEIARLTQVASDRLMWLRVLENAVNDVDATLRKLKADVQEISNAVAQRNMGMISEMSEEEE